jgi:hypothetical protein
MANDYENILNLFGVPPGEPNPGKFAIEFIEFDENGNIKGPTDFWMNTLPQFIVDNSNIHKYTIDPEDTANYMHTLGHKITDIYLSDDNDAYFVYGVAFNVFLVNTTTGEVRESDGGETVGLEIFIRYIKDSSYKDKVFDIIRQIDEKTTEIIGNKYVFNEAALYLAFEKRSAIWDILRKYDDNNGTNEENFFNNLANKITSMNIFYQGELFKSIINTRYHNSDDGFLNLVYQYIKPEFITKEHTLITQEYIDYMPIISSNGPRYLRSDFDETINEQEDES